jgi:vacuolar-type H+-ATPase subunit E/Vma4
VKISKDTVRSSGGVIVRAENGAKWIDNTFEARIERLESKVRDQVASILFE